MVSSLDQHAPYKSRDLFGGAVEMQIPECYLDVSDIAPIPDNQEVWADGDNSLIIEIVERSELPDKEVGRFYWQDLECQNESISTALEKEECLDVAQDLPGIPSSRCHSAQLVTGRQMLTKSRQAPTCARPVAVWLTVLRLPSVQSDMLITANFPCGDAAQASDINWGCPLDQEFAGSKAQLVKGMLRTLVVRDWSLFG